MGMTQKLFMKKLNSTLLAVAVVVALVAPALTLVPGCGTINRTSYQAVAVSTVSVQEAMALWNTYVRLNHPPLDQERAVKSAYEKWTASMVIVCDAGRVLSVAVGTNATNTVPVLSVALETAVRNAASERVDLFNLITKVTGKKLTQ